jgi:Fe-S-cluster containining protein
MTGASPSASATVNVEATIGGFELKMSVSVPSGPTKLDDLVPLLQILSDKVVSAAEQKVETQGACVSCRKGCGACCRQLVPVSPVEARHVARLVAHMPEPRKSKILSRFAAARRRLEEAGLWQRLNNRQALPEDGVSEFGLAYFRLGIPCPFLEDESCSIHLDRPLTCREYLVTSPAENCANPTPQSVAAARSEPGATQGRYLNWVPLIQALDWAAENPEPAAEKNGPDLLRQVLENLACSGTAPPPSSAAPSASGH